MARKIIYDMKEHWDLIMEALRRKFPTVVSTERKWAMMTAEQREALFLELCNHYGEDGWIIEPKPIQLYSGGRYMYLFRKQVYK